MSSDGRSNLRVLGLCLLAGMVVTVEAIRLHSSESMHLRHDDLSAWFACIIAGYLLALPTRSKIIAVNLKQLYLDLVPPSLLGYTTLFCQAILPVSPALIRAMLPTRTHCSARCGRTCSTPTVTILSMALTTSRYSIAIILAFPGIAAMMITT